jgi:hypothetical protein
VTKSFLYGFVAVVITRTSTMGATPLSGAGMSITSVTNLSVVLDVYYVGYQHQIRDMVDPNAHEIFPCLA